MFFHFWEPKINDFLIFSGFFFWFFQNKKNRHFLGIKKNILIYNVMYFQTVYSGVRLKSPPLLKSPGWSISKFKKDWLKSPGNLPQAGFFNVSQMITKTKWNWEETLRNFNFFACGVPRYQKHVNTLLYFRCENKITYKSKKLWKKHPKYDLSRHPYLSRQIRDFFGRTT